MDMKFKDWPFDKNEDVYLHWLRSPYHAGQHKQWQMQAVFRRENGTLHDLAMPWGALPAFRLGCAYRDGKPTGANHLGTRMQIRFCSSPKVSICDAISVPRQYELRTRFNLREKCVVIWNRGERIVVPCLEVIRAYFAPNRMMAAELLGPDLFTDICTSSLTDGQAHLKFSERVAIASLSTEVIKRMAVVLFDGEFRAAWKKVWVSASNGGGENMRDGGYAHPLHAEPPAIPGSSWVVRGMKIEKTILVLEIKQFSSAVRLPFSTLTCEHPGFRIYEGGKKGNGRGRTKEDPEEAAINPEPKSPKGITAPYAVRLDFTTADFAQRIEVVKVQERVNENGQGEDRSGGGGVRIEHVSTKDGTLYEEAGCGELPSVEFAPFKSESDVSWGFRKLFKALSYIKGASLSFCEGKAPEGCCLPKIPKISGSPRQYVLVGFSFSNRRFFIVEVDGRDDHGISTLLFTMPRRGSITATAFTENLLKKCIAGGGHWDKGELRTLFSGGKYELVKHTKSSSENWGMRLWRAGRRLF
ncbi:MAG: hypothetical protein KKE83_06895 [Proteobacteria bacterium]|nr:hypothetical protein [Pseudomonadota bacterium]